MSRIFILYLVLTTLLSGLTKPERYVREVIEEFTIGHTKDDPRFAGVELPEDFCYLVFPSLDGASIRLPEKVEPDELSKRSVLTVGYIQTKTMEFEGHGQWVEVDTILVIDVSAGDEGLMDRSVCEIHGIKMKREAVPVIYGIPNEGDVESSLHEIEGCPNGGKVFYGGCIVPDPPYDRVMKFVCPDCRKLYLEQYKSGQKAAHGSDLSTPIE